VTTLLDLMTRDAPACRYCGALDGPGHLCPDVPLTRRAAPVGRPATQPPAARRPPCGPERPETRDDPPFDGETYEAEHDHGRLTAQNLRVWQVMRDGRWRTLQEIAEQTGDPEASISARLRDLRKPRFGGHAVDRRSRGERSRGLFEYRLHLAEGGLDG